MAVNTESTTIADLPEATSLTDNDLLVLEAGGTQTKKTLLSRLKEFVSNGLNLTGTPTAPTAAVGTKTTQIATTAFVNNAHQWIYARGQVTVTQAEYYTICSVELPANSRFLVMSWVKSNDSKSCQILNQLRIVSGGGDDGGPSVSCPARTSTTNGAAAVAYGIYTVGSAAMRVELRCYGYDTATHTEDGRIDAFRIG